MCAKGNKKLQTVKLAVLPGRVHNCALPKQTSEFTKLRQDNSNTMSKHVLPSTGVI